MKDIFICLANIIVIIYGYHSINTENNAMILTIFVLIIINMHNISKHIKIFKLGKNGIELETTIQEAKDKIELMKNLAILSAENLSEIVTRIGRWDSSFNIQELYQTKSEIVKILKQFNIDNDRFAKVTKSIDKIILWDTLGLITERYQNSPKATMIPKIHNYTSSSPLNENFELNITGIENFLREENELDNYNETIINEIQNFMKDGTFININSLKSK